MPFSLRMPAKKISELEVENDFAVMPVELPVRPMIEDTLPTFSKLFKQMKSSLAPFGMLAAFRFAAGLPFNLPVLLMNFNTSHSTLCFSNLNASKVPFEFCGKKQTGSFYFVATMG